jgi:glycerol-1-phosphate dehydrogenase [NAD(P)+]
MHPSLIPHATVLPTVKGAELSLLQAALPEAAVAGAGRPRLLLLSDAHTWVALGEQVWQALDAQFMVQAHVLEGGVKPLLATAQLLGAAVQEAQARAVIAVGSGTINDLSKMAAHLAQVPCFTFATAASMNGYLSASASLIDEHGHKTSQRVAPPRHVWCALDVLRAAPTTLTEAGLGDALCRSTAQTDSLFAHLLLGTPYVPEVFDALAPSEAQLWETPHTTDEAFLPALIENCLLSGLGMQQVGSSAPASQAEHMLAHMDEMMRLHSPALGEGRAAWLHGQEMAVTSLWVAARWDALLASATAPALLSSDVEVVALRAALGDACLLACLEVYEAKRALTRETAALQTKLDAQWNSMRKQLQAVHVPARRLRGRLQATGLPLSPEALGWSAAHMDTLARLTRFTRDRFTCLDVAAPSLSS